MKGGIIQLWKNFGTYGILLLSSMRCNTVVASKAGVDDSSNHMIDKKRQDLIPYPRLGRGIDNVQEFVLGIHKSIPKASLGMRTDYESSDDKENRLPEIYVSSEYMLPYPRPGRSERSNDVDFGTESDIFMIPFYGSEEKGDNSDQNTKSTLLRKEYFPRQRRSADYLTPYPRMGKRTTSDHLLDRTSFLDTPVEGALEYLRFVKKMVKRLALSYHSLEPRDEGSEYMTPYPRIGKRDLIPYPRPGKRDLLPYPKLGIAQSVDLNARSEAYKKFLKNIGKSSDYMTPYPRPGKRDSTSIKTAVKNSSPFVNTKPLERYSGENSGDAILPYPRLGRSGNEDAMTSQNETTENTQETLIPYPRFGRSWSVARKRDTKPDVKPQKLRISTYPTTADQYLLPYPRPGRSSDESLIALQDQNNVLSNDDDLYILPYPRLGK